jgi:hypothetical protein
MFVFEDCSVVLVKSYFYWFKIASKVLDEVTTHVLTIMFVRIEGKSFFILNKKRFVVNSLTRF